MWSHHRGRTRPKGTWTSSEATNQSETRPSERNWAALGFFLTLKGPRKQQAVHCVVSSCPVCAT